MSQMIDTVGEAPVTPSTLIRDLLFHPVRIITLIQQQDIARRLNLRRYIILFLMTAALFFAATTLLARPENVDFNSQMLAARFFTGFAVSIPLLAMMMGIWAILQWFTSWFLDGKMSFRQIASLSGLSWLYYALMFGLSLPMFAFRPALGVYRFEFLLLILNLTAFWLLLRLFYTAYRAIPEFTRPKALLAACFPMLILIVTWLATVLLAQFAAMHHPAGLSALPVVFSFCTWLS